MLNAKAATDDHGDDLDDLEIVEEKGEMIIIANQDFMLHCFFALVLANWMIRQSKFSIFNSFYNDNLQEYMVTEEIYKLSNVLGSRRKQRMWTAE